MSGSWQFWLAITAASFAGACFGISYDVLGQLSLRDTLVRITPQMIQRCCWLTLSDAIRRHLCRGLATWDDLRCFVSARS